MTLQNVEKITNVFAMIISYFLRQRRSSSARTHEQWFILNKYLLVRVLYNLNKLKNYTFTFRFVLQF